MIIAPARRAGDPGSNPGPGENFSLKLILNHFIKFRFQRKIIKIFGYKLTFYESILLEIFSFYPRPKWKDMWGVQWGPYKSPYI